MLIHKSEPCGSAPKNDTKALKNYYVTRECYREVNRHSDYRLDHI